jgi:hypothetical protein
MGQISTRAAVKNGKGSEKIVTKPINTFGLE